MEYRIFTIGIPWISSFIDNFFFSLRFRIFAVYLNEKKQGNEKNAASEDSFLRRDFDIDVSDTESCSTSAL